MFPNIDVTSRLTRQPGGRWDQYLTVREQLIPIEEFRDESQSGNYHTSQHKYLCNLLRAVEVRCLKTTDPASAMYFEHTTLVDIVNTIRNNPEDFAEILEQRVQSSLLELPSRDEILCNEWHTYETAKLYEPAIFENKKEDKGFWF